MNLIKLIPDDLINRINKNLGTSTVVGLQRLGKVVTAKTAKSVRVDSERKKDSITSKVFAAGGMKYIVDGKPANTKLPMRKVGNKWELVQELKDWKAVKKFDKKFDTPDYVLAKAIAENKRDPVDVAGESLSVFQEMYTSKLQREILNYSASVIGGEIKKI